MRCAGTRQLRSDMGDRAACSDPVNDQASSMNRQTGINAGHEDLRVQSRELDTSAAVTLDYLIPFTRGRDYVSAGRKLSRFAG
jgi:hypothetical protein